VRERNWEILLKRPTGPQLFHLCHRTFSTLTQCPFHLSFVDVGVGGWLCQNTPALIWFCSVASGSCRVIQPQFARFFKVFLDSKKLVLFFIRVLFLFTGGCFCRRGGYSLPLLLKSDGTAVYNSHTVSYPRPPYFLNYCFCL